MDKNGQNRGRPTIYKSEYADQLREYFNVEPNQIITTTQVSNKGNEYEKTEILPVNFPTIEGFCAKIGISKQCFYEWIERHEEFGDACSYAHCKQAEILQVNGLNGKYNARFAGLAAMNLDSMKWKISSQSENVTESKFLQLIADSVKQISNMQPANVIEINPDAAQKVIEDK